MKILASLAVTFCWGKDINIVNKSYKILEVISAMVKKEKEKIGYDKGGINSARKEGANFN